MLSTVYLSTAIARKVLPCPHYITAIYRLDEEFEKLKKRIEDSTNTKEEKQEFFDKMQMMKNHFEKSYGVPTILNKYVKVENGRYLVFCKNKEHLDAMRDVVIDWFRTAGIKNIHSYAVYSDYPDKEKDYKDFCGDNSDTAKILFSINMLNEGLHIKDISGVLMLRTTQSNLIYFQQLGRLVEAGNMDKYLLVFDFVNNFSNVNDVIGLLQEIKNAVAKEKESDPDFDDSDFEDIDTFFVLEQVVEIQEMFKEIEGRLQGSWDLYIKALKQYKEREGDCLVPHKHIEILDNGINISLGNWVRNMRNTKNGKGRALLTEERIIHLEKLGFIWNELRYRFEKNIKRIAKYYEQNGEYPSQHSEDLAMKRLGRFAVNERIRMKDSNYENWKKEIIKNYLPESFCENIRDISFNYFLYYLKLYKEKYGHVNIKVKDVIEDYDIGNKFSEINKRYKNGKLSTDRIIALENNGLYLGNVLEMKFNNKIDILKEAVKNNVLISRKNQFYKETNFYLWIKSNVKKKYKNNQLSVYEKNIIEMALGKTLGEFFINKFKDKSIPIIIIDVVENRSIGLYKSMSKAIKYINDKFNIKIYQSSISNRLTGKVTTPYKGRFMFYYATDEEVKKYLDDNEVN